jgi:hypothetical protein
MRRPVIGLLLVLMLLGCASPSPPGPNPGRIQPGVGVEEVRLGADRAEVEARLGQPDETETNPFNARNTLALYHGKGLEISYDGDKVGTVVLHPAHPPWLAYQGSTMEGVWVGSNTDGVKKALGPPAKELLQALIYPGLWIRLDSQGRIESISLGD